MNKIYLVSLVTLISVITAGSYAVSRKRTASTVVQVEEEKVWRAALKRSYECIRQFDEHKNNRPRPKDANWTWMSYEDYIDYCAEYEYGDGPISDGSRIPSRGSVLREGFDIGMQYGDGLAMHCLRKTINQSRKLSIEEYIDGPLGLCIEALYGTGDEETNAIREQYPKFDIPEEMN